MESEDRIVSVKESADEAATRSIEAIEDLIVFTLKDPNVSRFHEAKRLCEIGQSLLKARARRAADFIEQEPAEDDRVYIRAAANALANQMNAVANPIITTNLTANAATTTGLTYTIFNTGIGTGNVY